MYTTLTCLARSVSTNYAVIGLCPLTLVVLRPAQTHKEYLGRYRFARGTSATAVPASQSLSHDEPPSRLPAVWDGFWCVDSFASLPDKNVTSIPKSGQNAAIFGQSTAARLSPGFALASLAQPARESNPQVRLSLCAAVGSFVAAPQIRPGGRSLTGDTPYRTLLGACIWRPGQRGNSVCNSCDWLPPSGGRGAAKGGQGQSEAAAKVSHPTLARMFKGRPVAIAIVAAFLVGAIAPDYSLRTIGKDYPSGAAAKVSHNRPVRMSKRRPVAIAIVTAILVGIFAPVGGPQTIRKNCPSGAAAKVSHNRPARMLSDQSLQVGQSAGGRVRWAQQSDPWQAYHLPPVRAGPAAERNEEDRGIPGGPAGSGTWAFSGPEFAFSCTADRATTAIPTAARAALGVAPDPTGKETVPCTSCSSASGISKLDTWRSFVSSA